MSWPCVLSCALILSFSGLKLLLITVFPSHERLKLICFLSFSTMRMHAQACVRWSKYTTFRFTVYIFCFFLQEFHCPIDYGLHRDQHVSDAKFVCSGILFSFTPNKFRRIGVPTRDSFSSRVLKVCNLSQVEARYLC